MEVLFEGVLAGGWPFVVGWVVPSATFVTLFALLVFPSISFLSVVSDIERLGEGPKIAVVVIASLAIAVLLNSLSTPMYRILEGYLCWPQWLVSRATDRSIQRRRQLIQDLGDTKTELETLRGTAADGLTKAQVRANRTKLAALKLKIGRLAERLQRLPVSDDRVVASRFGNAMRALETIGSSTYNLDTQVLWTELQASVPSEVNSEIDNARASVDVMVALVYVGFLFALVCWSVVFTTLHRTGVPRLGLGIVGLASLLLLPVWYRLAVVNTRGLRSSVQALVYVGRVPLAAALGLEMPLTIEKEREMWLLATQLALYGSDEERRRTVAAKLNPFRRTD